MHGIRRQSVSGTRSLARRYFGLDVGLAERNARRSAGDRKSPARKTDFATVRVPKGVYWFVPELAADGLFETDALAEVLPMSLSLQDRFRGRLLGSLARCWRRIRTPYESFLALTAIVACFMTLVGCQVIWGALCVLMLFAWCFYALIYMVIQDAKGPVEPPRWALRQMFAVTACIAVMAGAVVNHWPLRLRFAVSRPQLDQFADQLAAGRRLSTPRVAGLFVIKKAEMRGGLPCFWTDPDPSGYSGFVRCTPKQAHGFNLWFTEQMNDRWQLIIED